MRGEVAARMDVLRGGRRRGVKFEVLHRKEETEVFVQAIEPPKDDIVEQLALPKVSDITKKAEGFKPGHCAGCHDPFYEDGM